jgi:GxxExxY protein
MSTEPMQQEGYDFMAAAFEVYNDMGNGYTEDIYQEALELELADRKFPSRPSLS